MVGSFGGQHVVHRRLHMLTNIMTIVDIIV